MDKVIISTCWAKGWQSGVSVPMILDCGKCARIDLVGFEQVFNVEHGFLIGQHDRKITGIP
jgi:hypothetical protein